MIEAELKYENDVWILTIHEQGKTTTQTYERKDAEKAWMDMKYATKFINPRALI